ncbi:disease resistance protein [Striga asiatica]|uniref:Disease resistance protein n=1 Tax=Striga asiatica TaxID=4170 RepID=A0A5A7QHX1_STRAF|nr:disease resistance protein [Striga asiatica]
MVGLDDVMLDIMDKLTGGSCSRQTIPIVGMGGIGKTTLARNVYLDSCVKSHFDILAWATVSHEYNAKEILTELIVCRKENGSKESVDAWDRVKFFFPDNDNKSRVMITTRLSNLAFELTGGTHDHVTMSFLDEDKSWNLLCQTVFGDEEEEACPIELEENAEDEHCTKILQMSYDHLPVHLKPCFLYMGMYPQDSEIRVSNLTKLWIAEGFLKPIASKSFEQAAREYLNDLVDRNLVFVSRKRYGTKIKYYKLHDLLMELCVREAQKHKFLFSTNRNTPPSITTNQRRVVIHKGIDPRVVYALKKYSPLVRSFTRKSYSLAESLDFRLMRVWNGLHANISYSLMPSPSLVNCRYIDSLNISSRDIPVPHFWNLQTIFGTSGSAYINPLQIWKMTQLRHVKFDLLYLRDPNKEKFVLENLQELSTVHNCKFNLGLIKRIPNIKKLGLFYDESRSYLSESLVFPRSVKKLTLLGTELGWEDMARKIGCLPNLEILKLKVSAFVGPEWETEEGQFRSLKFMLVSYCTDLERWKLESSHFPCLEQVVLQKLTKLKELPREIGDIMALGLIELEYCSREAVVCARGIVEEQEEIGNEEIGNEELQARVVLSKKMYEEIESFAESRSNFQKTEAPDLPFSDSGCAWLPLQFQLSGSISRVSCSGDGEDTILL